MEIGCSFRLELHQTGKNVLLQLNSIRISSADHYRKRLKSKYLLTDE